MATSTGSRPLVGMNEATSDDPEGDADTEGSVSSDNEKSLFESSEQSGSDEKQPLSMKRRIALVGALLLCVFTIFAFAFLLPCHKPKCQKNPGCPGQGDLSSVNWTDKLGGITPVMISLVDVTGDGKADILVEFDITAKESLNSSFLRQLCKSSTCHGGGLLAIHGSCGYSLWDVSRNSSLGFLACERVADRTGINNNGHCLLVEEKTNFVLFNSENGSTKWQSASNSKVDSFKFVNDIDSDGERDIVFVYDDGKISSEANINLISGATGKILGNPLPLPGSHSSSNILAVHAPSNKQQFVIVVSESHKGNSTSLWAISFRDLLEKVRKPTQKIPGEPWGQHKPDPLTGFISILKDTLIPIEPLLTDLDGDGVNDVVFVIRENGISLLAMNGNDLAVMWRMVVSSGASIRKLLPIQHSVKENSTNVGVFVAYANHSSAILVISGQTGEVSWSFYSMSGIPVAPIPVPADFATQDAFVMWLPKLEAVGLISKYRKSRQIRQRDGGGNFNDNGAATDSAKKKISRQRRHQEGDNVFSESAITPSDRLYYRYLEDSDDNDDIAYSNEDDDESDDDDYIASKKFQLAFLSEILKESSDSPFAQKQPFNIFKEHDKTDNEWLGVRKENLPAMRQRSYSEDLIPIGEEENSDVRADPNKHTTELEEELSDLTNQKKHEANHKATVPQAPVPRDHAAFQSSPKILKEFPPEPTRREYEDSDFKSASRSDSRNQQSPTENDQQGNHEGKISKLASAKKPSYHKRSVQSSQSGSQCVRRLSDSADSYVALLLMNDADGRQLITEITEEGPLYLGPEEYDGLFNIKEGDTKSKSCLRLVPSLISEPVLRDSDEGLDLVYSVSFVSKDHSVHVGKIRKMSMADVFASQEGKIVAKNMRRRQSKRENDYSFSFPRVLK